MTVFVISLIRSNVPIWVGALITWLLSFGIVVPEEGKMGLMAFLVAVISGIYYLVVRLLEERYPQVGILLGFAKSPDSYSKGPGVEVSSKPGNEVNITVNQPDNTEPTVISGTPLPTLNSSVVSNLDRVEGPDHRAE